MAESYVVIESKQKLSFKNVQLFKNETLGSGSYGAVCKAKCDQLICAAKLLYPVFFQSIFLPDLPKDDIHPFYRFEEECRFMSSINHPNIVQYLGTYRDPETNAPVLLMELMDESLTHFLESSPGDIPHHVQVNLSQDIAQALAFLHANRIIHCDLSSNNVLLISGGRAKVSDFGMFKNANLSQVALTRCPGTPPYMAPEALDNPPLYTEKLDIFSFGVLLIQIMTRLFPEPSEQFETVVIPSPRDPSVKVKSKIPFPELTRRQAHISRIETDHSLLPIAIECLKDEAVERPFAHKLCESLDILKKSARYEESSNSDNTLQAKDKELREKDLLLSTKEDQLWIKEQHLRAKDEIIQSRDQHIRNILFDESYTSDPVVINKASNPDRDHRSAPTEGNNSEQRLEMSIQEPERIAASNENVEAVVAL